MFGEAADVGQPDAVRAENSRQRMNEDVPHPQGPCHCAGMLRAGSAECDEDEEDFPRTFGDYKLEAVLGRGGMGVVYKARHRTQGRTVALKMVKAGRLAKLESARFQREAMMIQHLEHPNLVPIYDVGEHEGQQYFTMRIIEGGSLDDHLDYYRTRPTEVAKLVIAIGRGVRYAHDRAIIHRDLKPGNILLDEDRQHYVVDFGLAMEMGKDSRNTASGEILGTLPYMAPEQTERTRGLSLSVDVYSLGAILYELLTGQPPIKGPTIWETVRMIREEIPRNPRLLNPKVDRDLATICMACLEKDPSKRYEDVGKLIEDLERYLEFQPIWIKPPGRAERILRWCRRKPGAAALIVVSTILVLVLGFVVIQHYAVAKGRLQERLDTNMSFARQIAGRIQERLSKWGRMVEGNAAQPTLVRALEAWNRKVGDIPDYKKDTFRDKVEALVVFNDGVSWPIGSVESDRLRFWSPGCAYRSR